MKIFSTLIAFILFSNYIFAQTPANDACANAQAVVIPTSGSVCLNSSNANATSDNTTNTCDVGAAGKEVWFTYIATGANNTVTVTPNGTNPASNMVVTLSSTSCTSGTYDVCNSASGSAAASATLGLVAGTQVWISVETNGTDGDFSLCITSLPPNPTPGNTCALATSLCEKSNFTINSLAGITASGTQPSCFTAAVRKDTWISFTVGQTGTLEFTGTPLTAIEYDWAVYNITSGCPGTQVACNYNYASAGPFSCGNPGSPFGMLASTTGQICPAEFSAPITVTAGQTYAIMIDNFGQTNGGFSFAWGGTFQMAPTASFTATPSTSCTVPLTVTLTNTSVAATSYSWNFGNGNTSTATNPGTQTYTTTGDYLISLTATNGTCTNVTTKRINLNTGPVIAITPSVDTVCSGSPTASSILNTTVSLGTPYNDKVFTVSPNTVITNNTTVGISSVITSSGMVNTTLSGTMVQSICFTINHSSHSDIGRSDVNGVTVNVNGVTYLFTPLPLPNVSGTATYCFPASVIAAINAAGGNANTTWTLHIADNRGGGGGTGSLVSWVVNLRDPNSIVSSVWSPTTNMTNSTTLAPTVSPTGTTTYTLTSTDKFGCTSAKSVTIVHQCACPAVTAMSYAGTQFCNTLTAAQAVSLTGTGLYTTGTYSAPVGLTINGSNGAITPSSSTPGTYTVTYTIAAAGSCALVVATTSVTITASPVATFSYTGSPYCTNAANPSPTFSGGGVAGTFTAPAGLSINSSTGLIDIALSTPGTYTVTNTIAAGGGCAQVQATSSVTITTLPTAVINYAGSPYCNSITAAQPVTLTGTAGGVYSSTAGLSINSSTGAITPSASTPATYTVTYTIAAAGGCAQVQTTTSVTINLTDNPAFSYSTGTFCISAGNQTPTITGTAGGTFTASPAGIIFVDNTTGEIDIAQSNLGSYIITYTTSGICPASATFAATITNAPSATFSYASPFCQYGTDPLPTFALGASAGTFSVDTIGLNFVNANSGEINLATSIPGTYTLYNTIAAGGGCPSALDSNDVTINAAPTITINTAPNDSICAGNLVTLSGSGADTYSWDNGITDNIAFSLNSSNTYTVTGTITATGCTGTAAINLVTLTLPTVIANTTAANICPGANVTLTGSGALSYTWDNSVTDGVAFAPPATNTYTVTGTDVNGCIDTDTITVSIHTLPTVTANAVDTTICPGSSANLFGSGASSYTWNNGVNDGVNFFPAVAQFYTVTGTDLNGCSNIDSIEIVINTLPTVTASASDTSVCPGTAVTLTGGGASTYTWDNGVVNNSAFTINNTTTYTVTGTDLEGCQNTDSVTIDIVNSLVVTANASDTLVCAGDPVILTGSGAGSYTWSNGITDGSTFNPVSTIQYTVTGASGTCTATDTITIYVNQLPAVVANTNDTAICPGGSVTLSGSGALTYTWNNSVSDNVSFAPSVTQFYTVTGTDANGCVNVDSIQITINTLPAVTANTTANAVCPGGSVTLTGGGASSYTWDNAVVNAIAFTPAGTLTYTVTGTDANGCQDTAMITITLNNNPTVSANATATTVCAGNPVTLTGGGASTYTWDNSVVDGVAFNPSAPLTYTVTGTDANGCQDTAMILINVNALPTVTANASANPVCNGGSVTLTGGGANTYTWDNGVTDGVSFNPAGTLTYIVTGTDLNGCQDTAAVTVVVGNPTVTANATAIAVCPGGSVTLTGGGASTYVWDNSVTDGFAFSPAGTLTYTVTGTDANGCQDTAMITITLNNNPTVSANATATTVCAGNPVTLTGGGASTYTWDNSVVDGVAFNPSAPLTYTVTGTDANGCQDTAMILINVNALPTVTANASANPVCNGGSLTLTGGGANTYTWDNGVTDAVTFNPSGTLTYIVTGTDVNNCQDTAAITVVVGNPTVTANATANAVCPGGFVTLTGGGASTYTWDNGVVDAVAFTPTGTLTYTVTGTDLNGCQDTAMITITLNNNPTVSANATVTAVCAGSPVTLTGGGASTYTWDNSVVDGVAFNPSAPLTYTVTGTDVNGCQDTAMILINVNALPTVTANATSTSICAGQSVTLTGSGADSYTWNNGVTDGASFNPAGTLTYTVTGTDNTTTCTNTSTVTVTVNQLPNVTANASATLICSGQAVTLNGGGAATYTWDNGVVNNVAFNPTATLTYTVTGTSVAGCTNTASVTVTIGPLATLTNTGTTVSAICGTNGGVNSIAPNTGLLYNWTNAAGTSVAATPDLNNATPGVYTLTVSNLAGSCPQTYTYTIGDQNTTVASFTASATSGTAPVEITFTNQSQNAISYSWNFGDGNTSTTTTPVNEYLASGIYTVVLTANGNGTCIDTAMVVITLLDSIVPITYPNIFSPNGDNINDLFYIKGNQLKELSVMIFDRWGLKIYEYDGVLGSWDGRTTAGNEAPTGVYYFLLDGTFKDGSKIPDNKAQGYVTLVR